MSYAFHKTDSNHKKIVDALRKAGASVASLAKVAAGAPDILVGWQGRNIIVEIKTPKGKLRESQIQWITAWKGEKPHVIRTVDEALALLEPKTEWWPV